jgi:hypothetical protein
MVPADVTIKKEDVTIKKEKKIIMCMHDDLNA